MDAHPRSEIVQFLHYLADRIDDGTCTETEITEFCKQAVATDKVEANIFAIRRDGILNKLGEAFRALAGRTDSMERRVTSVERRQRIQEGHGRIVKLDFKKAKNS